MSEEHVAEDDGAVGRVDVGLHGVWLGGGPGQFAGAAAGGRGRALRLHGPAAGGAWGRWPGRLMVRPGGANRLLRERLRPGRPACRTTSTAASSTPTHPPSAWRTRVSSTRSASSRPSRSTTASPSASTPTLAGWPPPPRRWGSPPTWPPPRSPRPWPRRSATMGSSGGGRRLTVTAGTVSLLRTSPDGDGPAEAMAVRLNRGDRAAAAHAVGPGLLREGRERHDPRPPRRAPSTRRAGTRRWSTGSGCGGSAGPRRKARPRPFGSTSATTSRAGASATSCW